jgi:hypothetical protein
MHGIRSTLTIARSARALAVLAIVVAATTGCQSAGPRKVAAEPGLNEPGTTIVQSAPPAGATLTWVDRHPLFSKPREYYENSGSNKVVKTAAATVIGIPAGIFGEVKQIVVGAPTQAPY